MVLRFVCAWLGLTATVAAGDGLRVRPGFVVEEIAAAPLEAPVALEWDAHGRLWVAGAGGDLKTHSDFGVAVTFATALGKCGGIFPWRTGMIVATDRDVLFLEDKDGDGRADARKVLLAGAANGFAWGLDGWLHGTNRDGRDFRFHPDSGTSEALDGVSQHGRWRDAWGNWYGNGDGKWLWHYSFDAHYRRPGIEVPARTTLANYGDAGNVYPAAAPVPLVEPASFAPYTDELFGPDFATSVFICEPARHIVHREVLAQDGVSFLSRRAHDELHSEFLASDAENFRPTIVRTAPDGSLIVVAPERGMFRVFPAGTTARAVPDLAAMDHAALVRALHSPSGWQRDTAQRLLIERRAADAVPELRRMVRLGKIPPARLQALATLATLDALGADDIRAGLRDRHYAPIRAQAVRLSEQLAADATLLDDFPPLIDDPDICVRRQLAFSLRAWSDPRALAMLTAIAGRIPGEPDLRPAVLSSLEPGDPLYQRIIDGIKPPIPPPKPTSPEREKLVASYASVASLKGDASRGRGLFRKHCAECHRVKNEGVVVGPDLAATAARPLAEILLAILDPSASVEPRYLQNKITLQDGTAHTGIVVAETKDDLTLRLPGGREEKLPRIEMTSQQAPGKSLMPDGLEASLKPQEVADVLAWLRD